jgi:hypothetical protein
MISATPSPPARSRRRGSYWLVLPAVSADALRTALDGLRCEPADVAALVTEEHRAFKAWLAKVSSGPIGLLCVG